MFWGFFSSKAVLFQLMLLLEKRHVFAQTIKLHPPTALRVETDLRLRGLWWHLLKKDSSLSGFIVN